MEARIGLLTVSDSRSRGEAEDATGPAARAALERCGFTQFRTAIVPDEVDALQSALLGMSGDCAVIFTLGGTGFAPRDVTPEATAQVIEKRADNLMELIRREGAAKTPLSYLSRGIAGVRGTTLIVNLPGSPRAAREGIEAIGPLLNHILLALQGEGCPH